MKIKQYKTEMAIRSMIESARKAKGLPPADGETDFDAILSLLPSEEDGNSDDDDDAFREVTLLLLRLTWAQAQSQLESMQQELELLKHAPPPQPREAGKPVEDDSWRLDSAPRGSGLRNEGPLLDQQGKPLRPFTILPAGSMPDRTRIQAEVFRPDHSLPTMTIDEYLEEEQRRGNILTGGGPQSLEQPTTSEQLAMDSEMDGTLFGEDKAEQKRQKDEKWARYADTHRKGEGNTMNRG